MAGFAPSASWIRHRRRRAAAGSASVVLVLAAILTSAAPVAGVTPTGTSSAAAERVQVIVTFAARPGKAAAVAIERLGGRVGARLDLVAGLTAELPRGQLKKLAADPLVRSVEIDGRLTAFDHGPDTGDLEYENAWGVEHIGTPAVHATGVHGEGVRVAIIDTGIDYIHDDPDDIPYTVDPEFNGNYRGGYDFFNGDADPYDDNGHGTHVAGILAAEKNGYLVVGVAPRIDLYALKILGATGEGEVSDLILALQWALDNDIDIVNMSLGTHEVSPALASAVSAAHAQGLLMVAASGNVNPLVWQELLYGCPVAYPGAYPEVLSTTFTNGNNALTGYSCTGPQVDFASPGDQVYSTVPIGSCMLCSPYGYSAQSGTSMASPHLAGTVALLLSAGIADGGQPGLLDDVRAKLCATADVGFGVNSTPIPPTDPRYPNYFGCGVIDADGAVLSLPQPPGNAPPVANVDDVPATEDTPADFDVLANDTDPDGDPIALSIVGAAAHGTTSQNAAGTVHYVPDPNFNGDDWFDYTITDGNGGTGQTSVKIRVAAVNDPPVAGDDTLVTSEDAAAGYVAVLANDTDVDSTGLSVSSVIDPPHGTSAINADGRVSYAPDAGYSGADSFEYTVSDSVGATDTGLVSVTVAPVDDPPTAYGSSVSVTSPGPATISLAGSDPDTCELTFQVVDLPTHGGVGGLANAGCTAGSPNGDSATVVYTPTAGYTGPDSFTYRVLDGSGASPTATVSIAVAPAAPPNPNHVGDLDGTSSATGKTWTAKVIVRVDTASHGPVSGAVVTGSWSDGSSGTASCTTGAAGTCTVQKTKLPRSTVASVTFTVTGVAKSGSTYDPSANHDPDGDSTGTSIVVRRPV